MTGMEHAIEQATKAILNARAFQAAAAFGVPEGADQECAEYIARALAEAGLLAPAPLREEWSTTNEWGDEDYCCGFDARETVEGDGRPIVRRYVSDWLPVDGAEGDGKSVR